MKLCAKYLILLSWLFLLVNINFVLAEDDCSIFDSQIVSEETYDSYITNKVSKISGRTNESTILKEQDYKLAVENLYAACCSLWEALISCSFEDEARENPPKSPYLSDHLLDIWFRKIDWNPDLIYDGIELYGSGKEWFEIKQDIIEDMANPIKDKKYTPKKILEEFKKYWWDFNNPSSNDFSLKKQYEKVCKEAYFSASDKLKYFDNGIVEFFGNDKFNEICGSFVSNKTKNEISFVSWLIKLNGSQMVNNNLSDYINKWFFTRLQDLSSVFEQVYTNFAKFNQRVIKQVSVCQW